jgi:hypothetical protein
VDRGYEELDQGYPQREWLCVALDQTGLGPVGLALVPSPSRNQASRSFFASAFDQVTVTLVRSSSLEGRATTVALLLIQYMASIPNKATPNVNRLAMSQMHPQVGVKIGRDMVT